MASIAKRTSSKGEITYRVMIRKKNLEVSKSFHTEEDAKLYAFYKERLIDNMANFEVDMKDRVTLRQVMELRMLKIPVTESKSISDISTALDKMCKHFPVDKFLINIPYEKWLEACKKIYTEPVFRGSNKEHNMRQMSVKTLRRVFATVSSAISHTIFMGIPLENHALKVIQTHINPMMKEGNAT